MIEFLNYVPVEGSVGEFLIKVIPDMLFLLFFAFIVALILQKLRKTIKELRKTIKEFEIAKGEE